ncbi:MAG: nucleotide exchange factor GrpE [Candidatus Micrarchaeia archaeon]
MANEEKANGTNKRELSESNTNSNTEAKQQENKEGNKQQQEKQQQQENELEKKEKEIAELKDRLLRLAAEFDNYKKKVASDVQSAKDVGKAELVSKLLPVIDAFEIALYSSSLSEQQKEVTKGFELIFSELYETLKNEGMQEVEVKGKFDPYTQEVLLTKPSEKPEGSVIEVVRKGYAFKGILIRPASVIVSNGKKE